jgi:3-isopropylmalate/(R)-2-methylmalate dehydratase small subunit
MSQAVIREIVGRGVPLPGNDIDTDRIIPARFLSRLTFEGMEEFVFADDRRAKVDHPFNVEKYGGGSILIVNQNFGCGSSREHAPQALFRWGIRAIVGELFGEIFFNNCTAIGLPCLIASPPDVQRLMEKVTSIPETQIRLDLEALTASYDDRQIDVMMPEGSRRQFVDGTWNSTYTLLEAGSHIERTAHAIPYIDGF